MHSNISQQAYTSMMKFTMDGRPFLKDIHDLFSALIVQIPIDNHRYLFRNYTNTFSSEDALQALGSLRFSHTQRASDPNDTTKQLWTTTTTTFNMARDMAKALCQQFHTCHLIENAVDSHNRVFREKGLWQLTPKGLCVLQDFCVRTGADMTSMRKHFGQLDPIQLVRLERQAEDDELILSRQNLSIVFRVMLSLLPLEGELDQPGNHSSPVPPKTTSSTSSNSSVSSSSTTSSSGQSAAPFNMSLQTCAEDSRVQLLSNYLLTLSKSRREIIPKTANTIRTVFSSQMCCDWLVDYSTVSSRDEAEVIANSFIRYGWLEFQDHRLSGAFIKVSKATLLLVTDKGKQILNEKSLSIESESKNKDSHVKKEEAEKSKNKEGLETISKLSKSLSLQSISSKLLVDPDTESQPTSLREILSQDPESVVITHTTSSSIHPPAVASGAAAPLPTMTSIGIPVQKSSILTATIIDHKEGNLARLRLILDDPQCRSLFKDFLRANFCEENLDFWIDYESLKRKCRSQSPALPSQNQKDLVEDAYNIWVTYLAPSAPSELNVEHSLRQEMARLVSSVVTVVPTYMPGQIKPTILISTSSASQSLRMMLKWFDRVDEHICRLMASDSVPKFIKTSKYRRLQDSREKERQKRDTIREARARETREVLEESVSENSTL
ncbi:regulator of G protein signaling domain-containing protein [Phycomyces blakesleeanus]|uniref:Regulator of G protein signaling domain-containing protein n=1 Tax=Phycomyces blakesleeanus TaxID=4837 RepID=A0ABR3ATM2_PHYBL